MGANPQIRERLQTRRIRTDQRGFTLVELLVVMLILALLAAIAIPAYMSQRDKAKDASAKSEARLASRALETYSTDNGGNFAGATVAKLIQLEPTISPSTTKLEDVEARSFTITSTSDTGNTFTIERGADGSELLSCATVGAGGCSTSGGW